MSPPGATYPIATNRDIAAQIYAEIARLEHQIGQHREHLTRLQVAEWERRHAEAQAAQMRRR